MAQIRDYQVGVTETQTLIPIAQADGSLQFLSLDGVLRNAFSDLVLYTDASGTSQIPGGVGGGNYEYGEPDAGATAKEAGTGGTGKTVYPQFKVTNATYQGIPLYATFTNFGAYTSNDAAFDQIGGSEEVTTSATLVVPEGYTRYRFNFDSSSGDIAPTIGNGAFDGQQIILKDTGEANMTRIKGSGFYLGADSGGMYLKSRSILCTWNADDSAWEMDDAVTAEWVSGDWTVIISAEGNTNQYAITSKNNASTNAQSFAYPIAILSVKYCNTQNISSTVYLANIDTVSATAIGINIREISAAALNAIVVSLSITVEGKY